MVFPKSFERLFNYAFAASLIFSSLVCVSADAADPAVLASALRIAGTVTGGLLPVSSPEFAQMVTAIEAGNYTGAATIAARSSYFARYLARRLAKEMQNPAMDPAVVTDSDAVAFLLAHFAGPNPSLSNSWSENATYLVSVTRAGVTSNVHLRDLTAAEFAATDFRTALVRVAGQTAKDQAGAAIAIPAKHVGGYITLSDRTDASIADYGATAGTNLRYIETIWQVAFGLTLTEMAATDARPQDVPRFIPEYDPNFFRGQGQPACMSCHAGGASSLNHGYSTLVDIFDFNNGLVYIAAPTTGTMKSLGSDPGKRTANNTCNLAATPKPVCNPDSVGADPNQTWDVGATWQASGLLTRMGWQGSLSGAGLNALGTAIGQAKGVYSFLTKRVINEVCPLGSLRDNEIAAIAANGQSADDIRTIVAGVASHPSCR
jgi:hypothetical protein